MLILFSLYSVYFLKYYVFMYSCSLLKFTNKLLQCQNATLVYTALYQNTHKPLTPQPHSHVHTHTFDIHYLTCSPSVSFSPITLREDVCYLTINSPAISVYNRYHNLFIHKPTDIRILYTYINGG